MTEISVYYPSQIPSEKVLTRVLEKILQQGERVVVLADSDQRLSYLNSFLWTYHPSSFLPHGTALEGEAERQPIWLTTEEENPNGASILIGMDGMVPPQGFKKGRETYKKCILILPQGGEAGALLGEFLKSQEQEGHRVLSFHQNPAGGWESF